MNQQGLGVQQAEIELDGVLLITVGPADSAATTPSHPPRLITCDCSMSHNLLCGLGSAMWIGK